MKTRGLTLLTVALLSTLLLGAGALLVLTAQEVIGANVAWDPKTYTWNGIPPDPWNAEVWLKKGHKAQEEIVPESIRLEDIYTPEAPPYPKVHGPRLVIPFDGYDVRAAILPKLPTHMGLLVPGTYRIKLKITGSLIGGELFEGYGVIRVTVPEATPA
jgi:hypothetical protein